MLIATGVQFPGVTTISDGYIRSIDDPRSNVNNKAGQDKVKYLKIKNVISGIPLPTKRLLQDHFKTADANENIHMHQVQI